MDRRQCMGVAAAATAGLLGVQREAHAQAALKVGGSTLAQTLMAAWAAKFSAGTEYQRVGSGAGIAGLRDGSLDVAVTDWPLSAVEVAQGGFVQVPLCADALVVVHGLGASVALRLSADALGDAYSGAINWAAGAIKSANPALPGAERPVVAFARADSSGSSRVFTNYISRLNRTWSRSTGSDFLPRWHNSVRTVRGTTAMVEAVRSTPGSLGYLGLAEARRANLAVASLSNVAAQFVTAQPSAITAAMVSASWDDSNSEADLARASSPQAWPMTAIVYAVFRGKGPQAAAAKRFLSQAVASGGADVSSAGFVELPASAKSLASRVLARFAESPKLILS
jgi:phosphate transport system substrate-binding protein